MAGRMVTKGAALGYGEALLRVALCKCKACPVDMMVMGNRVPPISKWGRIRGQTQCCSLNNHRCPVLTDIHNFIALARRMLLGSSLDHARI